MARHFTLEKAVALLILFTLVAVLAERFLLKTTLTLDASDGSLSHYSDEQDGGNSKSELLSSDALEGRCTLGGEIAFPYCGFELIFDEDRVEGLDLSNYERIKLWLDYQGPTPSIRLYLRNHDPRYSDPEVLDSTKYNQIAFDAELAQGDKPIEFSLENFFVANWWFQRQGMGPELAQPELDNIVILELQTGSNHQLGEHWFRLDKVEFTGQLLSTTVWYEGIMGTWLTLALGFLARRWVSLNRELKRKSEHERELMEINALLDSRSQQLEQRAKTDPLTGALNRDGIEEAVKLGLEEWRQAHKPLSVIMFDLDHFKQINDRCGHGLGDRVLSTVSSLVHENVRATDRLARWGGEEFVLVCRDTSLSNAHRTAEKLCTLIASHEFGDTQGLPVSASFGVVSLRRHESLDQLFERVDRALYQAKDRGRNCVVVSDPNETESIA